jgi:hypothetical protein
MPTKIEEIYDAICDILETSLSDYKRITNPYELTENSFLLLGKGYGIAIGPGTDTERYVGCLITERRSFAISIIRRMETTQNNLDKRVMIEKDILIDHDVLRKAFYNDSTLGSKAIKSTITDDSGINFIDSDRLKFLAIELNLEVEYQESPV